MNKKISIILPVKNESTGLEQLLTEIRSQYPDAELILVNGCSTDNTKTIAEKFANLVANHPNSMGNGAALKMERKRLKAA